LNTIIANSTSCIGILKFVLPVSIDARGVHSLSPYKYDFIGVGRKISESFLKKFFRAYKQQNGLPKQTVFSALSC